MQLYNLLQLADIPRVRTRIIYIYINNDNIITNPGLPISDSHIICLIEIKKNQ